MQHSPPQGIFLLRFTHSCSFQRFASNNDYTNCAEITQLSLVSCLCNVIGKKKKNKSSYVTEIVLQLEFADAIFRRRETTAGNTSAFAGYHAIEILAQSNLTTSKNVDDRITWYELVTPRSHEFEAFRSKQDSIKPEAHEQPQE